MDAKTPLLWLLGVGIILFTAWVAWPVPGRVRKVVGLLGVAALVVVLILSSIFLP